jgi:hypothetical protein
MQTIVARIEDIRARSGRLGAADVANAVHAAQRGRDAWNTPLVWRVLPDGDYVVVSAGPNQRFDVGDPAEYLMNSRSRAEDDIVFINGQQITKAGK